jgi:RNA-directed DNA polymerase
MMSKPKSSINLGTIKEETCLPALGHPAYRRRELITGVYTEREKLSSRCEGKTSSNRDCKRESADAWHGGGTSRSSEEAAVMAAEQRGSIVRPCQGEKLTSSGGIETDKAKPFSISRQSVYAAYRKVSSNNGSGGVDGISMEEFNKAYKNHLYKLWNRMGSGSYIPPAVRLKEIAKKGGGVRPLGIPTIADRVGQTVVKELLEQELEPLFDENSYGYRPGKSAIEAVGKAREMCWKYDWVVDLDIKGFFDNIPHGLLMKAVRKHCKVRWVLLYIERWLVAPLQKEDGTIVARTKGVPQGSVIGPILANLYLQYSMDKWLRKYHPDCKFERYADDAIVHCGSQKGAEEVKDQLEARMLDCGLELHLEKTKIVYCKDSNRRGDYPNISFDFLGYSFKPRMAQNSKRKVWFTDWLPAVSSKSMKAMTEKLKSMGIFHASGCTLQQLGARYDDAKRSPFNEAERGHHYARTIASWASVLALTGFQYSAVDKTINFRNQVGKWFWSNGYAWGTCEISEDSIILTVKKGTLNVGRVVLENEIVSEFKDVQRIEEGEELKVKI